LVYFIADNIVSPLGFTTTENFDKLRDGQGGIRIISDRDIYPEPFPASMIDTHKLE